jgi:hypothetical protein
MKKVQTGGQVSHQSGSLKDGELLAAINGEKARTYIWKQIVGRRLWRRALRHGLEANQARCFVDVAKRSLAKKPYNQATLQWRIFDQALVIAASGLLAHLEMRLFHLPVPDRVTIPADLLLEREV